MSVANYMNDEKELIDVARPLTSASMSTQLLKANDPFVPMLVSTGMDFQGTNSIQGVSVLEADTIIASNISGGGSVDMSGVEARLDTIIADLSAGLPPIQASLDAISVDLSSTLPSLETNTLNTATATTLAVDILTDISNGIGAIEATDVSGVESRLDTLNGDVSSGFDNVITGLQIIQGDISGVGQQLSAKSFQIFSNSGSPPLPYVANLIPTGCVLRKIICDVALDDNTTSIAVARTRFFDASAPPVGTEPVILTELHTTQHYSAGIGGSIGFTQHNIEFPDGGLVVANGLGVICDAVVSNPQVQQFAITIYYE